MARPCGQFNKQKEKLFEEIRGLSVHRGWCFATDSFLSDRLRVGERQIRKYIKALNDEKRLEVRTSKLFRDLRTGKLFKKRWMRPDLGFNSEVFVREHAPKTLIEALQEESAPKSKNRTVAEIIAANANLMAYLEAEEKSKKKAEEEMLAIAADESGIGPMFTDDTDMEKLMKELMGEHEWE